MGRPLQAKVMPHEPDLSADDHADGIVLLYSPANQSFTKLLACDAAGKWSVARDYDKVFKVQAFEHPVSDINSLSAVLMQASVQPRYCVIRGGIRPGFEEVAGKSVE